MEKTILNIEGMNCNHCAQTVQKALSSVAGVTQAEVSLELKQAVVLSQGLLDIPAAIKAVEEEGYKASPATL